jgi:hypothetical protein
MMQCDDAGGLSVALEMLRSLFPHSYATSCNQAFASELDLDLSLFLPLTVSMVLRSMAFVAIRQERPTSLRA